MRQLLPLAIIFLCSSLSGPAFAIEKGNKKKHARSSRLKMKYASPLRKAGAKIPALKSTFNTSLTEKIIWQENFENSSKGWTLASPHDNDIYWHTSQTGSRSGASYWCGNPALKGYQNNWYQLLVSPEIDLATTQNPVLTFWHDYAVEDPSGATGSLHGLNIDGWDGMLVQVSIDGKDFQPLVPSDGYPVQSLLGFLRPYNTETPGWAGKSGGWQQVTFDLSPFRGKKIRIRLEFGSDESMSVEDNNLLFGWRVDDIEIRDGGTVLFADDGGDTGDAQMTPDLIQINHWHPVKTRSKSPNTSWWCGDDATSKYPAQTFNYLVSPQIFIPPTDQNGETWLKIYLDFQHFYRMELNDNDKFDLFLVEISRDGQAWFNPYDVVFIGDSGNRWISFLDSYPDSKVDLSEMAGETIQIRWGFVSDASINDIGLYIDDPVIKGINRSRDDIAITDIDIPFPNFADKANTVVVEVANVGLNDQVDIPLWLSIEGKSPRLFVPSFPLAAGETTRKEFSWIARTPGSVALTAYVDLAADSNRDNDSLGTSTIKRGLELALNINGPEKIELGYDDRFAAPIYSNVDRITRFTPVADIFGDGAYRLYNLDAVRVHLFAGENRDDQVRITIGTAATPTTFKQILYDENETVPVNDNSFHVIDLSGDQRTRSISSDFIIRISFENSNGSAKLILDEGVQDSGHNYTFDAASGSFVSASTGAKIRAFVSLNTTGVSPELQVPKAFKLHPNYPNPVIVHGGRALQSPGAETRITFDLPGPEAVTLKIYDVLGREIKTLLQEDRAAGRHVVIWKVANVPAGIYFYTLTTSRFQDVRKMVIF